MPIPTVPVLHAPMSVQLEDRGVKPTTIAGAPREALAVLHGDDAAGLDVGIWECTPGAFSKDAADYDEICHILSGRSTLRSSDGEATELRAGSVVVIPCGWRGTWTVHETTRKAYTIVTRS
ncbi:cupin domain-containing protein [Conexibacter woesei]|uniref:(S)-ureidoglycine aminohydrolase cupin domain-containing protein n=1 Tax=Conexibacter woesei (strain DSM 14684 / CCUG 47730 / CIP 108061 / JCM 11494 / NBRC 100937 / ID131577) TaxID=469383 RepID=D3F2K7_CONWI|nr:cupin domain-containing protein [Conexibacter woesei]ADB52273.1 protein of unknown function DUF861 cupin_3 [Conexibacter woesei DSM 14684]